MRYLKLVLITVLSAFILCGCYEGTEPNNIAYITAMGIDKGQNNNDIEITIQFAKPTQISGGASEEGGKGGEIIENMVVEAPTIYAGINTANHMLSKEFSMAHMKLFVLSQEICEEGIEDILETMARSEEVRPNIYMAVAKESAKEYLEAVKPVIEINPVKYYQLVFEKNNFGDIPKNSNHDFYFYYNTMEKDNVLPMAGVAKTTKEDSSGSQGEESKSQEQGQSSQEEGQEESKKSASKGQEQGSQKEEQSKQQQEQPQDSQQPQQGTKGQEKKQGESSQGQEQSQQGQESGSGSGEESKSGESGESGSNTSVDDKSGKNLSEKEAPINEGNFEFHMKDYSAGQVGVEKTNKSEIMGMAVFHGDKMVGSMGSIDSVLYNMLSGLYDYGYITFKEPGSGEPVTIYTEQEKKPKIRYDKKNEKAYVEIYLEGDLASLSSKRQLEHDMGNFQKDAAKDIEDAAEKFLYKTSRDFKADVVGIGNTVKKKFWTYQKYKDYNWNEKYQKIDFEVKVNYKIRRTGLTIRTSE